MSQRRAAWFAAATCVSLAALWLVVVPEEADTAEGLRSWVLTYGHSLSWLLLAGTAVAWAVGARRVWVRALAYGAAAAYAGFVAALVV